MSRLRFFSFLAIAFAVLFVSCSKEKEPVDPNDDRHIVGYEEDGKGKFIYGDATILSDNDSINSLVFDSSMVTFYVRVRHYHYSDDTYEDSDPCTILEFYHKNLGQMNCDSIIYSADTSSFRGEGIFVIGNREIRATVMSEDLDGIYPNSFKINFNHPVWGSSSLKFSRYPKPVN